MSQHQGHLLLPLRPKHVQRLRHLPLASERPAQRTSLVPPAHNLDVHVLPRSHVSQPLHPLISSTDDQQCVHRRLRATVVHPHVPAFLRRLL
jgi:hypothetical protein